MEFGWGPKAFWIITVIIILRAVWYPKRNRDKPPNSN
jgi:dipeptide/tripeptide permease